MNILPTSNSKWNYRKMSISLLMSFYSIYYIYSLTEWHFIDSINLIFHEAGHTIFSLFAGEVLHAAAGSIMQVLIPIVCCIYFVRQKDLYSVSLLLFWVGLSLLNVSVYASDAIAMDLPLLGGESVTHDWNFILASLHLLQKTEVIAKSIYILGIVIIMFGTYFSLIHSSSKNEKLS